MKKIILLSVFLIITAMILPGLILAEESLSGPSATECCNDGNFVINTVSIGNREHGDELIGGNQSANALAEIVGTGVNFDGQVSTYGNVAGAVERPADNTVSSWSKTDSNAKALGSGCGTEFTLNVNVNPVQNNWGQNTLPGDDKNFTIAGGGSGAEINATGSSQGEPKEISAEATAEGYSVNSIFGSEYFRNANIELKNWSTGILIGEGTQRYYGANNGTLQTYLEAQGVKTFGFGEINQSWDCSNPTIGFTDMDATSKFEAIPNGFSVGSTSTLKSNVKPYNP